MNTTKIVLVAVACFAIHCGDDTPDDDNNPISNRTLDGGISLNDLGLPIAPENFDAGATFGGGTAGGSPNDSATSDAGATFGGDTGRGSPNDSATSDPISPNDTGTIPDTGVNNTDSGTPVSNRNKIKSLKDIRIGVTTETFLKSPTCQLNHITRNYQYNIINISSTGDVFSFDRQRRGRSCKYTSSQVTSVGPSRSHFISAFADNNAYVYFDYSGGYIVPDPASPSASEKIDKYGGRIDLRQNLNMSFNPKSTNLYIITTAKQLPGESANLQNQPLLVKYDMNGNRVWEKRLNNTKAPSISISNNEELFLLDNKGSRNILDSKGYYITIHDYHIYKLDKDGKSLWSRSFTSLSGGYNYFKVSADGQSIYLFGTSLLRLDLKGNNSWERIVTFGHEITIDPIEDVIWKGTSTGTKELVLRSDNGPCLLAGYSNSYENGSTARRTHRNILLSCFDENGDIEGTRQYRFTSYDPYTADSNLTPVALKEIADGTLILVGSGSSTGDLDNAGFTQDTYVFNLKADGSEK